MRCNEKTKIGTFKYEKLCLVRNAYVKIGIICTGEGTSGMNTCNF